MTRPAWPALEADVAAFVRALLAWGSGRRADLPWRSIRDPWHVLVAETMLQQTQTARVAPRYRDFLATFPDPATCASAPSGEVVRRWDGLGYNRRAVACAARLR